MAKEISYVGLDNTIDLVVSVDGTAIDHTGLTRVQIYLTGASILDSSTNPEYFDFTSAAKMVIKLGQSGLAVGTYPAQLVVFDVTHTNGLYIGKFSLVVREITTA